MLAIVDGDVLLYMSIWNVEAKEEAQKKFDELFTNTIESVFATDYVMALGGPDNFRVDLFPDYKGNRTKSKSNRPDWFLDLKSNVAEQYEGCVLTDNCEADDMVRVWANECTAENIERIVISVDKDLDCIEGLHYNPRKGNIYTIDAEYANQFYWKQVLMGDPTDNIPGLPKIGPKKADKILENSKDYCATVCKAYHDFYGEEGYNYLITNGRLIHIWRWVEDHFKIKREVYDEAIRN
jgi:DNA polymerase-1